MFKLIRQHDYSEAYNIFYQNNYVGTARIRHGYFRMDDAYDNLVYDSAVKGKFEFTSDSERCNHLAHGLIKLLLTLIPGDNFYTIEVE